MRARILSLLIRFFSLLPLTLLHGLGWLLGRVLYYLPNREYRNAVVNIALCFPELSEQEQTIMVKETLVENAKTLLEMPRAWLGKPDEWFEQMDAGTVLQEMRDLLAEGRGLIVAAPHLGNWEIGVHLMSTVAPVTILYRPPRQSELEHIMIKGRSLKGGQLVPTNRQGIKALYQALSRGEMVAVLPDQQPKPKTGAGGVFAPFFGVQALTITLINRLARKTGAPVYCAFSARLKKGKGYKVHGARVSDDIAAEDAVVAVTALNAAIEHCVRFYPAQYQWTYRRFEARPDGSASPYLKE